MFLPDSCSGREAKALLTFSRWQWQQVFLYQAKNCWKTLVCISIAVPNHLPWWLILPGDVSWADDVISLQCTCSDKALLGKEHTAGEDIRKKPRPCLCFSLRMSPAWWVPWEFGHPFLPGLRGVWCMSFFVQALLSFHLLWLCCYSQDQKSFHLLLIFNSWGRPWLRGGGGWKTFIIKLSFTLAWEKLATGSPQQSLASSKEITGSKMTF